MLKVRSHKKPLKAGVLPVGDHIVKIDSVSETINKDWRGMPWDDKTPQLAIRFKGAQGFITQWINLKGYLTEMDFEEPDTAELDGIVFKQHPFSKVNYAVDVKTNCRIENQDKTAICLHMIGRVAHCGGMPAGQELEIHQLIGLEMLIRVDIISGQPKVTHTFKKK